MKKMRLFALAALSLMGVTMTSCGDDDEKVSVDPVAQRMELLTNNSSKTWYFTSQIEGGEDITSDCQLDDIWTFSSEGVADVALNEECYEGQDDGENQFSWKFNEDATFMTDVSGEYGYEIIELTSTKLILQYEYDSNGKIFKSQMVFGVK